MSTPLDWFEDTRDMTERSRTGSRSANPTERARVASALGLLGCEALEFDYTIRPRAMGRFHLDGKVRGQISQACVVSLEPLSQEIDEEVTAEFWPPEEIAGRTSEGEHAILGELDAEALGPQGRLEIGRLAFEVLSAAIDPYPRKDGAEFTWREEGEEEGSHSAGAGPFAALEKLKSGPKQP